MRNALALAAVFIATVCLGAWTQDDAAGPAAGPEGEALPAAADAAPAPLKGDIITLTSGSVISGVQVLRVDLTQMEIELMPGLPPMVLPRKHVKSVEYDDIDPKERDRLLALQAKQQPQIIKAEELSKEFHDKISAPLSRDTIAFNDAGFRPILNQLAKRVGVAVEFDPSVDEIPVPERTRSFNIAPGTSFYTFLNEFDLAYPHLKVDLRYDKVAVSLRSEEPPSPAE